MSAIILLKMESMVEYLPFFYILNVTFQYLKNKKNVIPSLEHEVRRMLDRDTGDRFFVVVILICLLSTFRVIIFVVKEQLLLNFILIYKNYFVYIHITLDSMIQNNMSFIKLYNMYTKQNPSCCTSLGIF